MKGRKGSIKLLKIKQNTLSSLALKDVYLIAVSQMLEVSLFARKGLDEWVNCTQMVLYK